MRLTDKHLRSLWALVDGFFPPMLDPNGNDDDYWTMRLSADADYRSFLESTLSSLNQEQQKKLLVVLWLLSNQVGTSLVFGKVTSYPFVEWSIPERTKLLQELQSSQFAARKQIFLGLKRLICGLAYSYYNQDKTNPLWSACGYPGPPQNVMPPDVDQDLVADAEKRLEGIQHALVPVHTARDLECDIVIVGSGAGGSVAASVCARAGFEVLVLEKGCYYSPSQVTNLEYDAMKGMYENGGLLTTKDGNIMILAGATLGGGTSINWNCCMPLPEHVRREWAQQYRLAAFQDNGEFEQATQAVLARMDALDTTKVCHNTMNRVLQGGCEALGYNWEPTRQSLQSTAHPTAGYTSLGDRYANKNSGVSIFLNDAVSSGVKIIQECLVECIDTKINFERQHATGVSCRVGEHKVRVRARKAVIVAGGALQTPALLKRSQFRNRHIGRHLRLHPTTITAAFMKADMIVDCFLGAPLTTVCNQFELGPHGDGFGVKIECPSAHPGLVAAALPWQEPKSFKERLGRLKHAVPLVIIQRDAGEGRVRTALDGYTLCIEYHLSKADEASLIAGMRGGTRICVAGGASEITSAHVGDPGLTVSHTLLNSTVSAEDNHALNEYIQSLTTRGLRKYDAGLFSAHQMGTAAMSVAPRYGAVDPNGELWDCDNVYVMDTSIFPTASGSNPMLTAMAMAYMLSSRLVLRLRHKDRRFVDNFQVVQASRMVVERENMRSSLKHSKHSLIQDTMSLLIKSLMLLLVLAPLVSAWLFNNPLWFRT